MHVCVVDGIVEVPCSPSRYESSVGVSLQIPFEKSDVCALCGVERDDTFHVVWRCPMACPLWEGMKDSWPLPELATVTNAGKEWLLHLLNNRTELQRMAILMTFCSLSE